MNNAIQWMGVTVSPPCIELAVVEPADDPVEEYEERDYDRDVDEVVHGSVANLARKALPRRWRILALLAAKKSSKGACLATRNARH